MEPFAGYAFNKAHAVCYAMVAYQTAYLKANYPVEYMAALMACFVDKSDKLATCMEECKRMGIAVLPPDINTSAADFAVEGPGLYPQISLISQIAEEQPNTEHQIPNTEYPKPEHLNTERSSSSIRFGLAAIKNVGRAAVEVILRVREEGGPFTSLLDFCSRAMCAEGSGVSRTTIETLIQAGAFSNLPGHQTRRALIQILDDAMQSAAKAQRDRRTGQVSLSEMFGADGAAAGAVEQIAIPAVPEYPRDQLLAFERELLGLYISDHPLQAFQARAEQERAVPAAGLPELADRAPVTMLGIITSVKPFTSKRSGEPMAFFTLEDMTGTASCTMFPRVFAEQGQNLAKEKIVLLRGTASHRERMREGDEGGNIVEVLADSVTPLAGGSTVGTRPQSMFIQIEPAHRDRLRHLQQTVEHHRGNGGSLPVFLRVNDGATLAVVKTDLLAEYDEPLRIALERLLGRHSVWVE
jgi:DNA polymerase-3 subunit alpha